MKKITLYACEICGTEYTAEAKASACENRPTTEAACAVGDIVTVKAGFGWNDGDDTWISNPQVKGKPGNPAHGNCFSECCTMSFYYVCTAIDQDPDEIHRRRYHLFTKAMSGEQGHMSGYTFDEGHWKPKQAENVPQIVIDGSLDLIGRKAVYLL